MRTMRKLLAVAFGLVMASVAHAGSLYWIETNFAAPLLRSAAPDGSGALAFALPPFMLPEGIAFLEGQNKLYWVESAYGGARILRANPDYTGVQVLVSGGSAFRGLALDPGNGKMYWTSSNLAEGARIRRANLDGSNVEILVELGTAGSNPRGIALHLAAGKMYWADLGLGKVRRANLDGSLVEDVFNLPLPWGVAVNPTTGYLYCTSYGKGHVVRWPLTGGSTSVIRSGLDDPTYLTIDALGGLMYWIDAGASGSKLRRSTLAANGAIEDLPPTIATYGGLAFSTGSIVDAPEPSVPVTAFALGPITPNPASRLARIEYALPRAARVRLAAIDVRGREVAILVDGEQPAGRHRAEWTAARDMAAGVYFLRLSGTGVDLVQRCVLLP